MSAKPGRPLVFTDLDDTLFQTKRRVIDNDAAYGLTEAAEARDGEPAKTSYMTAQQTAFTNWLLETTELIPVTARSFEAYSRVQIPFRSWAILSNGALILEPGGAAHRPWTNQMTEQLKPAKVALAALLEAGRMSARDQNYDMRSWIVSEASLDAYVVFKMNGPTRQDGQGLDSLDFSGAGIDLSSWTRHRNGNNLALIPPGLGKLGAARWLRSQIDPEGRRVSIGAGDSLSDMDFMQFMDFALMPRRSQISAYIARTRQ